MNTKDLLGIALILTYGFYPLAELTVNLENHENPFYPYVLICTFIYIYVLGYIWVVVSKQIKRSIEKRKIFKDKNRK